MTRSSPLILVAGLLACGSALGQIDRVTEDAPPTDFPTMRSGLDIVTTPDGGCIVAGSDGGASGGEMGAVRFDAAGNVLWERKYLAWGGAFEDFTSAIFSIQPCREGGYIMAAGLGGFGAPSGADLCDPMRLGLIRINEDGEVLWAHRYGGLGWYPDVGMFKPWPGVQVRELPDGTFIAVGTDARYQANDFGGCDKACSVGFTGVMLRAAADGSPIWAHEIGEQGAGVKSRLGLADLAIENDRVIVLGTVHKLIDCGALDPAGSDTILFTTDFNGAILTSFAFDVVAPAYDCGLPECPRNEWSSSLAVRGGVAYIASNFPESRVDAGYCTPMDSVLFAAKYNTGSIGFAQVLVDAWISYDTLRFDPAGDLLFAGTRVDPDCNSRAYAVKCTTAGVHLWDQDYIDPRPSPVLFDIEAVHAAPNSQQTWMVGGTGIFGGNQLYLLGATPAGATECSDRRAEIPQVRPRMTVRNRPLEIIRELPDERIEVAFPKVSSRSVDPCRSGRGDRIAQADADRFIDFADLEAYLAR